MHPDENIKSLIKRDLKTKTKMATTQADNVTSTIAACKPPYSEGNPYCCTPDDYLQCDGECFGTTFQGDLDWYHFLLSSIGTWLAAALIVLIPRLIYAPLKV